MKPRKQKYFPVHWIEVDLYERRVSPEYIEWTQWKCAPDIDYPIRDYVKEFNFQMGGEGIFYYPLVF
jgi:hypothetical protein